MAESKIITKQLAVVEDLLPGIGKVSQQRSSGIVEVTKINPTEIGGALVVNTTSDLYNINPDDLGDTKSVIVSDPVTGGIFVYSDGRWNKSGGNLDRLGMTKPLCKFNMEQVSGKGNLQGIAIHDNKLYAYKNVKDNDAGIVSYSPGESGKVLVFDLKVDGSELSKVDEISIDKFGHQQMSYYTKYNKLFLVNSGGTPDDDEAIDIEEYSGYVSEDVYPNAGKFIANYNVETGENQLIRVAPDYDSDDKDTKWFHSVPYVTPDGKTLVVAFSDIYYRPRKIVRFFDFAALVNGDIDYTDYYNEISLDLDIITPTEYNAFQGLMYQNGKLLLQFGYYQPNFNKVILEFEESGTFIKKHKFYPSFIDKDNYKTVELEGMATLGNLCVSGLNTKDSDGAYMGYLILHGDGEYRGITENTPPSGVLSTLAIDNIIPVGEAYRIQDWDYDTEESELVHNITSYGNPQYRGTYIALRATKKSGDDFKPLSYLLNDDDTRECLQIRGWKKSIDDGAGINLYGKNDPDVSGADIHFFGDDFKFRDLDNNDIFMATSEGNLRLGSYIALDWDGEEYNKIINRSSAGTLEIRAKGALAYGGGINIYDKDHDTLPYSTKLYGKASDGGHLLVDDLETSDPGIEGALWNDGGTLKISAG